LLKLFVIHLVIILYIILIPDHKPTRLMWTSRGLHTGKLYGVKVACKLTHPEQNCPENIYILLSQGQSFWFHRAQLSCMWFSVNTIGQLKQF
uniref:Uncharacterized protein n=1 Tax=Labrus bergylta TaxID=56723 RepID=A0A3Q3FPC7_9LABR